MRGEDERTLGGGLGTAIFLMPLIFGWLTFRRGYHPGIRIVVSIYMTLSVIPLYMLMSILWNSGDDVGRLARDYERNRSAAERNAGTAREYMDQYENADLRPGDASASAKPVAPGTAVTITARALAKQAEADGSVIARLTGHPIMISGQTAGPASERRAFLSGSESYPAVVLEYDGAPPPEGAITATCSSIRLETIGPILGGCR